MDISVTTESWTVEDLSWLGSRDGTAFTQSITLDTSAFTAGTHYPNGYVPSGTVISLLSNGMYGPYAGAVNEVQTVTITGTPTGGTFTVTVAGETSAAIAYNATAAAVQTALEGLANINAGDVTVTGGPGPGTAYTVTFGGQYAGENVPAMTASGASLTGGSSPAVTVATTTGGGSTGTGGTQTPSGFLMVSTPMRTSGPDVGAALLYRGVIKESRLPAASGLDAAAKSDLANRFLFR